MSCAGGRYMASWSAGGHRSRSAWLCGGSFPTPGDAGVTPDDLSVHLRAVARALRSWPCRCGPGGRCASCRLAARFAVAYSWTTRRYGDLLVGELHVIVTDGFAGNVALKHSRFLCLRAAAGERSRLHQLDATRTTGSSGGLPPGSGSPLNGSRHWPVNAANCLVDHAFS